MAGAPTGPLVSCVLPTRDRPAWVEQAVRYFRHQTHPTRELLVVDTGAEPVAADLARLPGIRVVRPGPGTSLGQARNIGASLAAGPLIAHWDDDDWYAPDRIARQVAALTGSHAQVCGLGTVLAYRLAEGDAWRYQPLPGDRPYLAGSTLMYRREAWCRQPFPDIDIGEDASWLAMQQAADLLPLPDAGWFVAVLHRTNCAPKDLADPRWSAAAHDEVVARLAGEQRFYAGLRTGGRARTTTPPGDAVTVAGDFLVYDGMGSMAEYAALGLDRAGVDVRLAPFSYDADGLTRRLRALARRPAVDGPVLYWSWPREELSKFAGRRELFLRPAWESSVLPGDWVPQLGRARAVVVPSRHVADACRASGVTVPLSVVPDGVDPDVHHLLRRPERETCTTLVVATLIARKHLTEAVAAWQLAFHGERDARLIVKARFRAGRLPVADPRITVVDTEEATRGLARWYREADVLLALGNEGFGLPLVEGMATGLPVVALDSEGQRDVCRDAGSLVLSVPGRLEPYDDPRYGRCGVAAVPDVQAAADRLRWVATHRDDARALGREASAWVLRHRDVRRMGPAVLEAMEARTSPVRALRRRRTLWVSSWSSHCGVSEYTDHLVHGLRGSPSASEGVHVTAGPPDRSGLRLLHVQHEDGLFDDELLSSYVESVREPVVVTEHSVGEIGHRWEQRADRLIALTDEGAATLRERVGEERVVRLHHGCPTWFPPRKKDRGRVLGCFGFLAPHKGFEAVLDVLPQQPGTELVLYSHPRSRIEERAFERRAAGLPVRWHRGWLPPHEVARRLAAECDALVFWYDEAPHASASGAARVGLASGVPVLASSTTWFSDLRDVTYQPADLGQGVDRLLTDTDLRDRLCLAAREHCSTHSWRHVAVDHLNLWQSVESA